MKKRTTRTKKTKSVKSARAKTLASDAYTDTLDAALTSAEENLRKFLPTFKPSEIGEAFATHVHTHLSTELSNIAAHGHRNDDPEDVPSTTEVYTQGMWQTNHADDDTEGRYVISSDGVLIADCYADTPLDLGLPSKEESKANIRLIAKSPQMSKLVNLIARMKTEEEFGDNAPPSEDWISTLNDLIAQARVIAKL